MFIRKGVGYDEVFPSGHGLKDGSSWSTERELSAHSLDDEEENYDGEEVEDGEGEKDEFEDEYDEGEKGEEEGEKEGFEREDDSDEGEGNKRALGGEGLGSPGDGHTCPFILPKCGSSMILKCR